MLRLFAMVVAAGPGVAAQAGPITVGRGGELGGAFSTEFQTQEGGSTGGAQVRQFWVRFPVRGYLLSPNLLSFELEVQPTSIRQGWRERDQTQRSDLLNLVFAGSLLPGKPLSLTINGARSSTGTSGGPSGQREYDRSNLSAQFRLRFRPLPVRVTWQRERTNEVWTPELAIADPFRVAGVLHSFRASAVNSRLSVQLSRTTYDDLVRDQDYVLSSAQAFHRFHWGRGSSLESGFGTSDQGGAFTNKRREWTERLQLYHTTAVRTDYTFSRTTYGTPSGESVNQSMTANVTVAPTSHVGLGALVSSTHSTAGRARDNAFYVAPRIGLGLGTIRTGRLDANVIAGLERRSVTGAGEDLPVFEEQHEVGAARLFALDRPDVVDGSVELRNPLGTITYILGTDYELTTPAGRVTQVRILLGSRIQVGDIVSVSYRVRGRETGIGSSVRADINISLEWRGVSLRHQRSMRQAPDGRGANGQAPATSVPMFESLDESRTRLGFQGATGLGDVVLTAGLRKRTIGDLEATEWDANATLTPPQMGSFQGSVTAGWNSTAADGREQEARTLSGNVAFRGGSRLHLSTAIERTDVDATDGVNQRWLVARVTASLRIERVVVDLQAEHFREQEPLPRSRSRTYLRFVRSF